MIEVDLDKDLLLLRYDPSKVQSETLLEAVGRQGFEGKIVPAGR